MAQDEKIITNQTENETIETTTNVANATTTTMPTGRKLKVFQVGAQMQATSNRPGLTRSEIYECVAFNSETYMVDVINDDNHRKSYPSSCFRMMKDDFAKMFGIDE